MHLCGLTRGTLQWHPADVPMVPSCLGVVIADMRPSTFRHETGSNNVGNETRTMEASLRRRKIRRSVCQEPTAPTTALDKYLATAASKPWSLDLNSDPAARNLWSATQHGLLERMRQLLHEAGVNPNEATRVSQETALHIAVGYRQHQAAKLLLAHPRTDPNVQCPRGGAPIHLAAHSGDTLMLCLLLKHPDININLTLGGSTPLMLAVQQGHLVVLDLLLRRPEIETNALDERGNGALHVACYHGKPEVVLKLLQHPGTDLGLHTTRNHTPLDVAMWMQHERIIGMLKEATPCTRGNCHAGSSMAASRACYRREKAMAETSADESLDESEEIIPPVDLSAG